MWIGANNKCGELYPPTFSPLENRGIEKEEEKKKEERKKRKKGQGVRYIRKIW
jgi:hypothetical protein